MLQKFLFSPQNVVKIYDPWLRHTLGDVTPFIVVVGNTFTKLRAVTLQNTYCRFITHLWCVAFVNLFKHFLCVHFSGMLYGVCWYLACSVTSRSVRWWDPITNLSWLKVSPPMLVSLRVVWDVNAAYVGSGSQRPVRNIPGARRP